MPHATYRATCFASCIASCLPWALQQAFLAHRIRSLSRWNRDERVCKSTQCKDSFFIIIYPHDPTRPVSHPTAGWMSGLVVACAVQLRHNVQCGLTSQRLQLLLVLNSERETETLREREKGHSGTRGRAPGLKMKACWTAASGLSYEVPGKNPFRASHLRRPSFRIPSLHAGFAGKLSN